MKTTLQPWLPRLRRVAELSVYVAVATIACLVAGALVALVAWAVS